MSAEDTDLEVFGISQYSSRQHIYQAFKIQICKCRQIQHLILIREQRRDDNSEDASKPKNPCFLSLLPLGLVYNLLELLRRQYSEVRMVIGWRLWYIEMRRVPIACGGRGTRASVAPAEYVHDVLPQNHRKYL